MEIKGLDDLIVSADVKVDPDTLTGKRLCDVTIGHIISASGASNSKTRRPAAPRPGRTGNTHLEEIIDGSDFI